MPFNSQHVNSLVAVKSMKSMCPVQSSSRRHQLRVLVLLSTVTWHSTNISPMSAVRVTFIWMHYVISDHHYQKTLRGQLAAASYILVLSLDYCNSLYSGLSVTNLNRLQRVQNDLARVVLGLKKFDHITAGLMDLHWLPIKYRIDLDME